MGGVKLIATARSSATGRIYILAEPIHWRGITVPKGYQSDLASVPRILQPIFPRDGVGVAKASIIHDFLLARTTRRQSDRLFLQALEDFGVGKRRYFLYWGVRLKSLSVWEF